MAYLILVRHGESEWNAQGIWTGLTDVPLSKKGIEEAKNVGGLIKNFSFYLAYTSKLMRAIQTLEIINQSLGNKIPVIKETETLNERDYGIFTGKNKWDIEKEVGKEKFSQIRRGWDYKIPEGESLKDVYNRVVPYYRENILPDLTSGKNILIVAHGNSLRALVKYLENISNKDVLKLEIKLGSVYFYEVDNKGKIIKKTVLRG